MLECLLNIVHKAREVQEWEIIESIFQAFYSVLAYPLESAKAAIKTSLIQAISIVMNEIPQNYFAALKLCTFYTNDGEAMNVILKKPFVVSMMKSLENAKGEALEHILTLIYDLAGNSSFQKILREIPWEDSLHYLIEVYPKYREPIAFIFVLLSRVSPYYYI